MNAGLSFWRQCHPTAVGSVLHAIPFNHMQNYDDGAPIGKILLLMAMRRTVGWFVHSFVWPSHMHVVPVSNLPPFKVGWRRIVSSSGVATYVVVVIVGGPHSIGTFRFNIRDIDYYAIYLFLSNSSTVTCTHHRSIIHLHVVHMVTRWQAVSIKMQWNVPYRHMPPNPIKMHARSIINNIVCDQQPTCSDPDFY